jgi:hypothetical protein
MTMARSQAIGVVTLIWRAKNMLPLMADTRWVAWRRPARLPSQRVSVGVRGGCSRQAKPVTRLPRGWLISDSPLPDGPALNLAQTDEACQSVPDGVTLQLIDVGMTGVNPAPESKSLVCCVR